MTVKFKCDMSSGTYEFSTNDTDKPFTHLTSFYCTVAPRGGRVFLMFNDVRLFWVPPTGVASMFRGSQNSISMYRETPPYTDLQSMIAGDSLFAVHPLSPDDLIYLGVCLPIPF